MRKILSILLLLIFTSLNSQDVDLNKVKAGDEFMWGVKFYNQGLYEKSVFSFEKSLSYDSINMDTHLWLGRAYYMKGDVQAALKEWKIVQESGKSPLWLDSIIEIITSDIGVANRLYTPGEWVTHYNKELLRPSSIYPLGDGSIMVVSFLDNLISRLSVNGSYIENFNGGIDGLNRPFDIATVDDGYIVTEFMGDRVVKLSSIGFKESEFTTTDYPISGPGFIAKDNSGYIYVTDWGNKRVVKFSSDGKHILSINHSSLKGPTGVAVFENRVFVSDSLNRRVLEFDRSGNYIGVLLNNLDGPEGLTITGESTLLVADTYSLKEYNFSTGEVSTVTDLEGKASRITKGVRDANGNTIVSDFNLNKYYSLTDINSLYTGLYITIDRINTLNYPDIQLELNIRDRLGNPIVGLDNSNLLISEGGRVLPERNIIFKGNDNRDLSLSLILDFDHELEDYFTGYYDLVETILNDTQPGDDLTVIQGAELPIVLGDKSNILENLSEITTSGFTNSRGGIDQAIKLSSSSLIQSGKRREILLVTNSNSSNNDFNKYSLDEIISSLKNSRVSLNILYLTRERNRELDYISQATGGKSSFLFVNQGAKGFIDDMRDKKNSYYLVAYKSLSDSGPGDSYISVEAEVNYIRKSGRSESGYYTPGKITN